MKCPFCSHIHDYDVMYDALISQDLGYDTEFIFECRACKESILVDVESVHKLTAYRPECNSCGATVKPGIPLCYECYWTEFPH